MNSIEKQVQNMAKAMLLTILKVIGFCAFSLLAYKVASL